MKSPFEKAIEKIPPDDNPFSIFDKADELADAFELAAHSDVPLAVGTLLRVSGGTEFLRDVFGSDETLEDEAPRFSISRSIMTLATVKNAPVMETMRHMPPAGSSWVDFNGGRETASVFLAAAFRHAPPDAFHVFCKPVFESLSRPEARDFAPTFLSRLTWHAFGREGTFPDRSLGSVEKASAILSFFSGICFDSHPVTPTHRAASSIPPFCREPELAEGVLALSRAMGGPVFDFAARGNTPRQETMWPAPGRAEEIPREIFSRPASLVDFALSMGSPESARRFLELGVPFDQDGFFLTLESLAKASENGMCDIPEGHVERAEAAFLELTSKTLPAVGRRIGKSV